MKVFPLKSTEEAIRFSAPHFQTRLSSMTPCWVQSTAWHITKAKHYILVNWSPWKTQHR